MMNWKGLKRMQLLPKFRSNPSICFEGPGKPRKISGQWQCPEPRTFSGQNSYRLRHTHLLLGLSVTECRTQLIINDSASVDITASIIGNAVPTLLGESTSRLINNNNIIIIIISRRIFRTLKSIGCITNEHVAITILGIINLLVFY
jgi:hypothetical protein